MAASETEKSIMVEELVAQLKAHNQSLDEMTLVESGRRASDNNFVSAIRFHGVPILPPVMTKKRRDEIQVIRLQARTVERRIQSRKHTQRQTRNEIAAVNTVETRKSHSPQDPAHQSSSLSSVHGGVGELIGVIEEADTAMLDSLTRDLASLEDVSLPTEYGGLPLTSARQQHISRALGKLSQTLNIRDSLMATGSTDTDMETLILQAQEDDRNSQNSAVETVVGAEGGKESESIQPILHSKKLDYLSGVDLSMYSSEIYMDNDNELSDVTCSVQQATKSSPKSPKSTVHFASLVTEIYSTGAEGQSSTFLKSLRSPAVDLKLKRNFDFKGLPNYIPDVALSTNGAISERDTDKTIVDVPLLSNVVFSPDSEPPCQDRSAPVPFQAYSLDDETLEKRRYGDGACDATPSSDTIIQHSQQGDNISVTSTHKSTKTYVNNSKPVILVSPDNKQLGDMVFKTVLSPTPPSHPGTARKKVHSRQGSYTVEHPSPALLKSVTRLSDASTSENIAVTRRDHVKEDNCAITRRDHVKEDNCAVTRRDHVKEDNCAITRRDHVKEDNCAVTRRDHVKEDNCAVTRRDHVKEDNCAVTRRDRVKEDNCAVTRRDHVKEDNCAAKKLLNDETSASVSLSTEAEGKEDHINRYLDYVRQYALNESFNSSNDSHDPGPEQDTQVKSLEVYSESFARSLLPDEWNQMIHLSHNDIFELQNEHFETLRKDLMHQQKTQLEQLFEQQQTEQFLLQKDIEAKVAMLEKQQMSPAYCNSSEHEQINLSSDQPCKKAIEAPAPITINSRTESQSVKTRKPVDELIDNRGSKPPTQQVTASSYVRLTRPLALPTCDKKTSKIATMSKHVNKNHANSTRQPQRHPDSASTSVISSQNSGCLNIPPDTASLITTPSNAETLVKLPPSGPYSYISSPTLSVNPKDVNTSLLSTLGKDTPKQKLFDASPSPSVTWLNKKLVQRSPCKKPLSPTGRVVRVPVCAYGDHMKLKYDRLTAVAKGFLTRRLIKTDKVQDLIKTINDTRDFAINFQQETLQRGGNFSTQDRELLERIVAQLQAALLDVHEIFFSYSLPEQMGLIAQSREVNALRQYRTAEGGGMEVRRSRVSSATFKAMERKRLALSCGDNPVTTRPKSAPPTNSTQTSQSTENRALRPLQSSARGDMDENRPRPRSAAGHSQLGREAAMKLTTKYTRNKLKTSKAWR